ncbi:LOW QUALITY PROTEIN: hypothetical protein HID58_035304 [Brassica napus]|uniref:Uncharacterized protein n=1 Tax=Brassica napus TaxID=3708 RepID=A0ABQ8C4Q6_BRANA|nr:LOW QUALITY PROTEIN: hypothetical protein HID58_035304 [Brassica napus]
MKTELGKIKWIFVSIMADANNLLVLSYEQMPLHHRFPQTEMKWYSRRLPCTTPPLSLRRYSLRKFCIREREQNTNLIRSGTNFPAFKQKVYRAYYELHTGPIRPTLPPEPPDPPDPPPEPLDVPLLKTTASLQDMTYPPSPPISIDLCGAFPSRSRTPLLHLPTTSIAAKCLFPESGGQMKCRQDSTGEESAEQHRSTDVPLSNLHGGYSLDVISRGFINFLLSLGEITFILLPIRGEITYVFLPSQEKTIFTFLMSKGEICFISFLFLERSSLRIISDEKFQLPHQFVLLRRGLYGTRRDNRIRFVVFRGGWCLTSHFKVTKFQPSGYAVNLQSMESRLVSDLQAFEDLSSLISVAFMFYCNDQRGWLIPSCNPEI